VSGRARHAVNLIRLPLGCALCAAGQRAAARHAHRAHVLTAALDGPRRFVFAGGRSVDLSPGAVLAIPAETVHAVRLLPPGGRAVSLSVPAPLLPALSGVCLLDAPHLAAAIAGLAHTPETLPAVLEDAAAALAGAAPLLRGGSVLPPTARRGLARVRRAGSLLAAGEPLAGAAAEAGFYDQSHMTRQFLRLFGMTPGEYRAGNAAAETGGCRSDSAHCRERDIL